MAHKGYTWPGYNYLGPGNEIYSEEDIVNSTDFIAYVHDLEYTLADTTKDIREADRKAIASFVSDFKENGRAVDLIGILGLGVKYGVESVFGVQYPSMSDKKKTFPQLVYGERERHLSQVYQSNKSKYVNYQAFKKSEEGQRLIQEYAKDGYYYKHLHAQYTAQNNNQIEKAVEDDFRPGPSTSKRPADTGSDDTSKLPRIEENPDFLGAVRPTSPLSPGTIQFIDDLFHNPDTGTVSESASRASVAREAVVPMDTTESGTSRGPNTGARAGASGVNAVGGRSSGAESDLTWIRPSNPSPSSIATFTKTRILISYGYSTENIQLGDPDYVENVTTPLGLIPVDYVPFYLSNAEFEALPFGSKIVEVECKVTPLGTRTAFDTGTTLSGTATSEYVPIGLICEGLNIQFYGRNKQYEVDSANPMKPTNVSKINPKEIAKKYYEHVSSNALCVPQPIEQYYVHEWNRPENPDANKLPKYMVHNYGVARMDEKVHQFLINQAIGKEIVHYKYKPKNGLIKAGKDHFVPWNRNGNAVETTFTRPRSMALQFFSVTGGKPAIGDVGLGKDSDSYVLINQVTEQYYRKIENYGAFHPARGVTGFNAQPQLHVGLVATPQLNPGTNSISYLNSACYWKIECMCKVTFNVNSAFSKNNAISWPLEVTFIQNATQKYTDGQCLFGNTDTGSGNVGSTEESDDEYDIVNKETEQLRL